ncbi:ABC transporter substrate-binding protein [Arthrobacter sp. MA-N2]|uniref:ABC transporter substrate-binding protein n=1 Tax=Arthrobacter sp. MA-N2 TaxID=1101188 RepID=UPI00048A3FDA|nr:ABC transporter substrate-binding protein [Arthrobacter sp. MA-N2]
MKINGFKRLGTKSITTAAALCVLALAGCSANATTPAATAEGAPEISTMKIGVTPVGDFAPIYYAKAKGIFEKHGLNIDIDPKGASEVPPLVANSYQAVTMSWTTYIQAVAQNVPLKAVFPGIDGEPDTQTGIYTMKTSGITTAGQLAGKSLAVNQPRATFELNSRIVLQEKGLDPSKVNFQVLPLPTLVDALAGGKVDSAYLLPPFSTIAESKGAQLIIDPYKDSLTGSPIAGYVMTADFVQKNPRTVAAFQAAMKEAADALNADPKVYRDFVTTYTTLTPELAQKVPAYVFPTAVNTEKLQELADVMAKEKFSTRTVDISKTIVGGK